MRKGFGRMLVWIPVLLCLLTAGITPGLADSGRNEVDLYLPGDPEVGNWEYALDDEELMDVKTAFYADIHELGLIGTDGAEWIHLTGAKPGNTTLRMMYINSFTLRTDLTLVYRVTVDEKLNILINGFEMLEPEWSPRGEITSFFFTRGGYERPRSYALRRDKDGNLWMETDNDGEQPADEAMTEALASLVEEYHLVSWNGFNDSAKGVLDGESFLFTMVWENGFGIEASGDNAFPENYDDFRSAVEELFGAEDP